MISFETVEHFLVFSQCSNAVSISRSHCHLAYSFWHYFIPDKTGIVWIWLASPKAPFIFYLIFLYNDFVYVLFLVLHEIWCLERSISARKLGRAVIVTQGRNFLYRSLPIFVSPSFLNLAKCALKKHYGGGAFRKIYLKLIKLPQSVHCKVILQTLIQATMPVYLLIYT